MMQNRRKLWLFFVILVYFLVAILGFFLIYFIKTSFFTPKLAPSKAVKTVVKTTPVPIPKGWGEYTNTDYHITLSYPPTDTFTTSSYGFGITNVTIQNSKTKSVDFQLLFLPKSIAEMVGQDFDTYYSLPNNTTRVIKNPLKKDNTTEKFTKIRNRTIKGNQALDYRSIASNAPSGSPYEIGTIISVGNNLLLIATSADNKKKLEELLISFTYSE